MSRFELESGMKRLVLMMFVGFAGGLFHHENILAQETAASNSALAATQTAEEFYQPDQVQEIHLEISQKNLEKLHAALPKRIYVPAKFQWKNQTIENVGVRFKGNSSSNPNQRFKRSFLIKFSEYEKDASFLGLQRVALDNGIQFGSLFSEQLITSVLHDLEIPASRCNFAKLLLNGKYHGVYTNVERIDEAFLQSRFSNADGPLYKNDEGGLGGNLSPFQLPPKNQPHSRMAFEAKSESAHKDAREVTALINKIQNTPTRDFVAMRSSFELDNFLKTMAVMCFSGAFDQLTGWNAHNFYLYHDPSSGRWHYLPWDLDVGFSDNAFGRIPVISGWNAAWPIVGRNASPLLERIVSNPELLARYRQNADLILEEYFHPDRLLPKLDELFDRIKDDLVNDPFPHVRVTNPDDKNYESIVESIKDFVRLRYQTARAQLDNPGPRPPLERSAVRPGNDPRREPEPGEESPDAPGGLHVVEINGRSVSLKWNDNANREIGHMVQRADIDQRIGFRNALGRPGTNSTTAIDQNVTPGQTYRYRVFAVYVTPTDHRGSGVSNVVEVKIPLR